MNANKFPLSDALYALLKRGSSLSAAQLQAATGKSQASISLALKQLGAQVHKLGAARSTRYALKKDILGLEAEQSVIFTDSSGSRKNWGMLTHLQPSSVVIATPSGTTFGPVAKLPWFLTPLRPQGFLGRQYAQLRRDFPPDPEQWSLAQILCMVIQHAHNAPGAFNLGSPSGRLVDEFSPQITRRLVEYDMRTVQVSHNPRPGSSAGGEQPKFLSEYSTDQGWQHCIVKYTPPHGTPFGGRWRALLILEELALRTLSLHGVDAASTQVLHSTQRSYLESLRFDRAGMLGQQHVVAIAAIHDEYVGGTWQNWAHTAAALAKKGLITTHESQQIARIFAFGHFIGNTDMHSGNLSFYVDDVTAPKIRLAPVYDMLPMMWRPDIHSGNLDPSPLREPLLPIGYEAETALARTWAIDYWQQASCNPELSAELQALCVKNARRLQHGF